MKIATMKLLCVGFLCLAPVSASAELKLSITITGTPEELIPLLEKLSEMGVGTGSEEESDEPVRMEMHSVTGDEEAAAEEKGESDEPPGLWGAAVTPAAPRPGEDVLVTLQVSDPSGQVDTIACVVEEGDGFLFDLYDNGTHGDEIAGDGVWSYLLTVPTRLDVDTYTINVTPYDRRGNEIAVESDDGSMETLSAEIALPVTR